VISLEEGQRRLDALTGRLEIPEDGRVCRTGISVIRDEKMVWVQCSMRRSVAKHDFSMKGQGNESDNPAPEREVDMQYVWEFEKLFLAGREWNIGKDKDKLSLTLYVTRLCSVAYD
jgi:hypothetical protein